jgi:hypothetical protein
MAARLITGLTPSREQALQERMLMQLARSAENPIKREIARATRAIAAGKSGALEVHKKRMNSILTRLYKQAFKMFGRRLLNNIVKHNSPDELKKGDVPETPQFDLARQMWISSNAALKVTQIAGTTEKQALDIIRVATSDAIEAGTGENRREGRPVVAIARQNDKPHRISRII